MVTISKLHKLIEGYKEENNHPVNLLEDLEKIDSWCREFNSVAKLALELGTEINGQIHFSNSDFNKLFSEYKASRNTQMSKDGNKAIVTLSKNLYDFLNKK